MTAARRPSPIARNLEAENASLRAELGLAQQRTRDIEAARQKLERELGDILAYAPQKGAQAASNVVALIRGLGIAEDVLKILGHLYGWHDTAEHYDEEDDDD